MLAGRLVEHDVDGEVADVGVGPDERVGALELGASPGWIGKPEPQPGCRPGVDVVEQGRRGHGDPDAVGSDVLDIFDGREVVAPAESAQHGALETSSHHGVLCSRAIG